MTASSTRFSRILAAGTAAITMLGLSACNNVTPVMPNTPITQPEQAAAPMMQAVVGDYADAGYENRSQGYDWVGVMVRSAGNEQIDIKVRARSDIKNPTCHFNGTASLMGQDKAHGVIFQTKVNDSTAFFQFKDGMLTIDSQNKYALNQFCSGGGTLVGDYQKLSSDLDLT
ncbi:hypothetical protein [Psychrobacter halodurans]|uniref:Lipoprotein n=1 Tax=Psychrobacter halodurans TaxID=2818439 RepID=A0AAW4IN89_9GAMM|nr:hypothetical protein [Psychrobacter halodurans]MBO1516922.1 hypothetical protein [Psychrobacter halodurans]